MILIKIIFFLLMHSLKKKISCLVLCVTGAIFPYYSFHPSSEQAPHEKLLNSIDPEDRFYLDFYFRHLMLQDPLSYVLFGDKPMGLSAFSNPSSFSINQVLSDNFNKSLLLKKGFELHKKYLHLFSSKNFLFIFKETDNYIEIALVNRKNFLKVTKTAIKDFQAVLGNEFSGEKILEEFIKEREILEKPLRENHALLGLLLGYGKKNSFAFQRKIEVLKEMRTLHLYKIINSKVPSNGFNSLNAELASLDKKLLPFYEKDQQFSLITLPSFMADRQDRETQALTKKYIQQRKNITKAYQHGNFLEITFKKLASS
jgi:hypothetical protein